MAPFKSTGGVSVGKLLGVFRDRDLTLNSSVRTNRYKPTFISSGGTKIVDGSDVIHIFTGPGTLTFNEYYESAKFLLAGGGGSGGQHRDNGHYAVGGGGAGGMISLTGQTFTPGSHPIIVGPGGTAVLAPSDSASGNDGTPSTALGYIAEGGGGGGGYRGSPAAPQPIAVVAEKGRAGGSGGGSSTIGDTVPGGAGDKIVNTGAQAGGSGDGTTAAYTPQGNPGGTSSASGTETRYGGGGGGAGGAGGNGGPAPLRGDGGVGVGIDWIPLSYGTPGPNGSLRYFAGGGGAAPQNPSVPGGTGGYGGGGAGLNPPSTGTPATPGTANTGGGGGARSYFSAGSGTDPSGAGGSGIFAIRFINTNP